MGSLCIRKTTSLIDILKGSSSARQWCMSFDSFDYSCLKRISQAHPLDWPSELYNMISGPFAQRKFYPHVADAWKLFERTSLFSLTFWNNIQMPLIIVSCNPILIEIQNHPIYMFYMSLITIILVFSQVFFEIFGAFCFLYWNSLNDHYQNLFPVLRRWKN